jgi:DNA polymerase, archaea type
MPEVTQLFQDYVQLLKGRGVDLVDLVITKQLSKDSDTFEERNTVEKGAIDLLSKGGRPLKAGQVLQYIVTDYDRQKGKRSMPIDLADEKTAYDAKWYIQKLTEVVNSMTEPFG